MTHDGHRVAPLLPDLERIRSALEGTHIEDRPPDGKHAAVALVLAGGADSLHVCLIRRAVDERDRWSGHMALPGGLVVAADASARGAAIRETWEEVGLRLDHAPYLGSLRTRPVSSKGKPTGISLSSFVFYLGETLEPLKLSDEVAEAFWVPLQHLLDPCNAVHKPIVREGVALLSPAVLYQGHHIWGLTYHLLTAFFEHLRLEIPQPKG